jgi:hypothetical protein
MVALDMAGDAVGAMALYSEAAALGAAASTLGTVVPILGAALAISQGNYLGAVASILMMVNPIIGMVVMVLSAILGGDEEPVYDWIPARGEGNYLRGPTARSASKPPAPTPTRASNKPRPVRGPKGRRWSPPRSPRRSRA